MDKAIESEEDLYEVLGVAPEASDADIKKVYRKLVLKYHPDKLAGKSEEEQRASQDTFQKLVTAYEVLSNPHQRAIYDTRAAKKGGKQDDVFLNITLKESVVGAKKLAPVPFKKRCSACKSLGMICKPCEPCGGKPSWASNGPKCTVCQGRGFGEPQVCDVCKGHGETEEFDMVRLEIPAGAATGTRIPVPGKSVHARVFVLPSKIFRRDGYRVGPGAHGGGGGGGGSL
uniref:Chaperone n=1 Tax=Tetraselmis sp. GSL018 TaxID=582737 RepID=A0A061RY00_9CHLO